MSNRLTNEHDQPAKFAGLICTFTLSRQSHRPSGVRTAIRIQEYGRCTHCHRHLPVITRRRRGASQSSHSHANYEPRISVGPWEGSLSIGSAMVLLTKEFRLPN